MKLLVPVLLAFFIALWITDARADSDPTQPFLKTANRTDAATPTNTPCSRVNSGETCYFQFGEASGLTVVDAGSSGWIHTGKMGVTITLQPDIEQVVDTISGTYITIRHFTGVKPNGQCPMTGAAQTALTDEFSRQYANNILGAGTAGAHAEKYFTGGEQCVWIEYVLGTATERPLVVVDGVW